MKRTTPAAVWRTVLSLRESIIVSQVGSNGALARVVVVEMERNGPHLNLL